MPSTLDERRFSAELLELVLTTAALRSISVSFELTDSGDVFNDSLEVDLNNDGFFEWRPSPLNQSTPLGVQVNGTRTIRVRSIGTLDPTSPRSFLQRKFSLIIKQRPVPGRIQEVLSPCGPLQLVAEETFTDAVSLRLEGATPFPQLVE